MGDLVADAAGLIDHLGLAAPSSSASRSAAPSPRASPPSAPTSCAPPSSSTPPPSSAPRQSWRDRIAKVRAGGIDAIADQMLTLWFTRAFHAARADELAVWRHMLTRTPVDGYCGSCAALSGMDLRESTARLRLPVLVAVGDEDGSTPPDLVRETAESIAGARFEIIRGAGHIPCVEQPAALAALITGFLKEQRLV